MKPDALKEIESRVARLEAATQPRFAFRDVEPGSAEWDRRLAWCHYFDGCGPRPNGRCPDAMKDLDR